VQRLERRVPPDDAVVEVEDEQAIVERLENVLVEGAHAIELQRLHMKLAVQPRVFQRGRDLSGDRRQ